MAKIIEMSLSPELQSDNTNDIIERDEKVNTMSPQKRKIECHKAIMRNAMRGIESCSKENSILVSNVLVHVEIFLCNLRGMLEAENSISPYEERGV